MNTETMNLMEQLATKVDSVGRFIPEKNIQDIKAQEFVALVGEDILIGEGENQIKVKLIHSVEEDAYYKKKLDTWYKLRMVPLPKLKPKDAKKEPEAKLNSFEQVEKDIKEINSRLFKARGYIDDKIAEIKQTIESKDKEIKEGFEAVQKYVDIKIKQGGEK